MTRLTVLYDEGCEVCRRAREWMLSSPLLVPVELVPAGSFEALSRFGPLPADDELWVVSDTGDAWVGPAAFVMCLWALADHRWLAELLASPLLAPLARRFFRAFSSRRRALSAFLDDSRCGEHGCSVVHDGPYRARARGAR